MCAVAADTCENGTTASKTLVEAAVEVEPGKGKDRGFVILPWSIPSSDNDLVADDGHGPGPGTAAQRIVHDPPGSERRVKGAVRVVADQGEGGVLARAVHPLTDGDDLPGVGRPGR